MHNYGMTRTTIVLPEPLKRHTEEQARRAGMSFAEFVRRALQAAINEPPVAAAQRRRKTAIAAMMRFREDAPAGPADLTARLDDYLYGDQPAKRKP